MFHLWWWLNGTTCITWQTGMELPWGQRSQLTPMENAKSFTNLELVLIYREWAQCNREIIVMTPVPLFSSFVPMTEQYHQVYLEWKRRSLLSYQVKMLRPSRISLSPAVNLLGTTTSHSHAVYATLYRSVQNHFLDKWNYKNLHVADITP